LTVKSRNKLTKAYSQSIGNFTVFGISNIWFSVLKKKFTSQNSSSLLKRSVSKMKGFHHKKKGARAAPELLAELSYKRNEDRMQRYKIMYQMTKEEYFEKLEALKYFEFLIFTRKQA
jgi:hypothetical protein